MFLIKIVQSRKTKERKKYGKRRTKQKKGSKKFDKVTVKRKDVCNLSNLERVY